MGQSGGFFVNPPMASRRVRTRKRGTAEQFGPLLQRLYQGASCSSLFQTHFSRKVTFMLKHLVPSYSTQPGGGTVSATRGRGPRRSEPFMARDRVSARNACQQGPQHGFGTTPRRRLQMANGRKSRGKGFIGAKRRTKKTIEEPVGKVEWTSISDDGGTIKKR